MEVDTTQLYNLLVASQNSNQVKQAEQEIDQLQKLPGFFTSLFSIISHEEAEPSIKLAAAILLKNNIDKNWETMEREQEKQMIRQHFMNTFVTATNHVQAQLALCLYCMVAVDFPEKWNTLLDEIMGQLKSNEPVRIRASLLALYQIAKRYEAKRVELREPLNHIVEQIFPLLLQLGEYLLQQNDEQSAEIQKLVCKIFWASTQTVFPPFLKNSQEIFDKWMMLLKRIVQTEVPPFPSDTDPDDIAKSSFWKSKKWVAHIVQRFMRRFVSLVYRKSDSSPNPLAQHFIDHIAVPFFDSFLHLLLQSSSKQQMVPDNIRALAIEFIDVCCVSNIATFSRVKENEDTLIQNIIFPELCFNDKDQELWEEDQQEFIRRQDYMLDIIYDPRMAAQSALKSLANSGLVQRTATFIIDVFQSYQQHQQQGDPSLVRSKEGAMYAMGSVAKNLAKITDQTSLESVIKTHVYPELHNAEYGFIRARALWTLKRFCRFELQDEKAFFAAIETTVNLLRDPDFPVRVQAGLTVSKIVELGKARDELRPMLGNLLDGYFDLISEMENSSLVECVSTLVHSFPEEVAPMAVQLCAKLVDTFMRVSGVAEESEVSVDETNEESAMAAISCLAAINTLLQSVSENKSIFLELEPILLPLAQTCLENALLDFMEDICMMMSFITFCGEHISNNMWQMFPLLYSCYMGCGHDYLADMLPIFDNLITRDTTTFLKEPTYLQMVLSMANKSIGNTDISEYDLKPILQLVSVVIQHCKGHIDDTVPNLLELVVKRLSSGVEKEKIKVLLFNVISDGLYYNAQLTLHVLQSLNCVQDVFTLWFNSLSLYKSTYDKKVAVLGFSSLFQLSTDQMPPTVRDGLSHIISATVSLLLEIDQDKKSQPEENEENYEDYISFEDDDSDNEDPEALMALLQKHSFDPEEDLEEEDDYESIIHEIDENRYFAEACNEFANRENALFQEIAGNINSDLQEPLQQLLQQ
eukprot:gb/GECH01008279.1/.p1 GENE.gb/GECH01008279.1/~~gb/GECH01008279.1/.p1  ORF type:complete len:979 (+),score=247.66 gb/GECH01008279.1/:1-2937(+)